MDETDLIDYVARVQQRTQEAAAAIPAGQLHWRPAAGELAAGELVMHIANARLMNGRRANTGVLRYDGHELPAGATLDSLLATLDASSAACLELIRTADLSRPMTLASAPGDARAWRILLGGLMEHEIHHRSQLCSYLTAMGLEPPALFGLRVEDLPR